MRSCLGGRTLQGILRDREEVLCQIFESIKRLCAKFVEWFELEWRKDFKPITYFVWNSFAFVSSTSSFTIQFFPPKSFGRLLTVESLTQATEKLTFDHNQDPGMTFRIFGKRWAFVPTRRTLQNYKKIFFFAFKAILRIFQEFVLLCQQANLSTFKPLTLNNCKILNLGACEDFMILDLGIFWFFNRRWLFSCGRCCRRAFMITGWEAVSLPHFC